MAADDLLNGLDMVELVTGVVFGSDASLPAVPRRSGVHPRQALEGALAAALAAGTVGVAFSGGRDSSGILAAATAAARRHRLPEPVPVTLRFPGVATTEEATFQEAVVRRLGLTEWVVLEPGDALDIVGGISAGLTSRHGVLYPSNVHIVVPMLEALGAGTLLTGSGGDEMLGGHPYHAAVAMLSGRSRPRRGPARALAKRYLSPGRIRAEARDMAGDFFTWLRPPVRAEVAERFAVTAVERLLAHRHLTEEVYPARYLHRMRADMDRVAAEHGMTIAHPFLEPRFVGALADRLGRAGYRDRATAMSDLFGDLLPAEVIQRTSKASFDAVFWTRRTDEAVEELPVERLADWVDPEALRRRWRSDELKGNTSLIVKYLVEVARREGGAAPIWVDRPAT